MEKINRLTELYTKHLGQLIAFREQYVDLNLEGPILMDLDQYWSQPIKLFIVGQETYGWNCDYNDISSQQKTYRNFNMGERYHSSPFWNITRKLERLIGIGAYSCAWSNLNRYDYDGGAPTPEFAVKLSVLDYLLREEVQIIKPDICLFYTNRKYDNRLRAQYEGLTFEKVSGLPFKHFCRLVHPDLPIHSYRTPHPKTIRIQSWEEGFISAMERELPKNKEIDSTSS